MILSGRHTFAADHGRVIKVPLGAPSPGLSGAPPSGCRMSGCSSFGPMSAKWTLPRNEVSSGITGASRSSNRGAHRSRKSRQLDTSSANVTLLHKPTGITVTGQVPLATTHGRSSRRPPTGSSNPSGRNSKRRWRRNWASLVVRSSNCPAPGQRGQSREALLRPHRHWLYRSSG